MITRLKAFVVWLWGSIRRTKKDEWSIYLEEMAKNVRDLKPHGIVHTGPQFSCDIDLRSKLALFTPVVIDLTDVKIGGVSLYTSNSKFNSIIYKQPAADNQHIESVNSDKCGELLQ